MGVWTIAPQDKALHTPIKKVSPAGDEGDGKAIFTITFPAGDGEDGGIKPYCCY